MKFFLRAMSMAHDSRDLNIVFVKLGCLSAFWFACQNFGLFARILVFCQKFTTISILEIEAVQVQVVIQGV